MALTVSVAELVEQSRNPLLQARPGWPRVRLGDIATVLNGYAFKSDLFTRDDGVPLIRIRDVGSNASETRYKGEFDTRYLVNAGELLIGMDGDFNSARWRGEPSLLNQRVCKVTVHSKDFDSRFLDYLLPGYLRAINEATSSTTVKHLSSRSIEDIPLPFPPLPEQIQIVEEFEKQFSRLDEAVANLKRVKANLKRYKAAVLKAAVEGRLVPTEAELARKEGRTFESGAELFRRVLNNRRNNSIGKSKFREPAAPETDDLPITPEGWEWVSAEQVCDPIASGSTPPPEKMQSASGEVPFIKVYNLTFGDTLDFTIKPTFVDRNTHVVLLARSKVFPGDVLMNIVGPPLGKVSIADDAHPEWNINQAIVTFRSTEAIDNRLLASWLLSNPILERLKRTSKATAGQSNLQVSTCRKIALPLPPAAEQKRIVAEIERHLSLISGVEAQTDANLVRAERTRQSILAKMFSVDVRKNVEEIAL